MEQRAKQERNQIDLRTIIVAVDFSTSSEKALRYATAFAERFGARLVIVSVIETAMPTYDLGYVAGVVAEWEKEVRTQTASKLLTFTADHLHGAIVYTCVTREGYPTEEILAVAAEHNADLIVMGTHGRTGLKHMFLGSVAEKTVRYSSTPVLTVRESQREFVADESSSEILQISEIVAPTDFSETAEHAVAWAEMLAQALHARLNLLHVVPNHYPVGEYDAQLYPQLEAEMMETGRRRLNDVKAREGNDGLEVITEVVHGEPRHEILQFAEKQMGDLVVMGTRGRTGLKHLVLGSTAEYVIRHSPCAVITIPHVQKLRGRRDLTQPSVATA